MQGCKTSVCHILNRCEIHITLVPLMSLVPACAIPSPPAVSAAFFSHFVAAPSLSLVSCSPFYPTFGFSRSLRHFSATTQQTNHVKGI
jgi:hypothetical protein